MSVANLNTRTNYATLDFYKDSILQLDIPKGWKSTVTDKSVRFHANSKSGFPYVKVTICLYKGFEVTTVRGTPKDPISSVRRGMSLDQTLLHLSVYFLYI